LERKYRITPPFRAEGLLLPRPMAFSARPFPSQAAVQPPVSTWAAAGLAGAPHCSGPFGLPAHSLPRRVARPSCFCGLTQAPYPPLTSRAQALDPPPSFRRDWLGLYPIALGWLLLVC
jgi:hypothetical protein